MPTAVSDWQTWDGPLVELSPQQLAKFQQEIRGWLLDSPEAGAARERARTFLGALDVEASRRHRLALEDAVRLGVTTSRPQGRPRPVAVFARPAFEQLLRLRGGSIPPLYSSDPFERML